MPFQPLAVTATPPPCSSLPLDPRGCRCAQTSPTAVPTHWGQTALFLHPPLTGPAVELTLRQSTRNHHDLNITLAYAGVAEGDAPVQAHYSVTGEAKGYEELNRGDDAFPAEEHDASEAYDSDLELDDDGPEEADS